MLLGELPSEALANSLKNPRIELSVFSCRKPELEKARAVLQKLCSRAKVSLKFAKLELVAKIKLIAHGANSLEKIEKALKDGADLVEVDVSKQVFTNKFVAQHQGVLGKFGIGVNLEKILTKIPQEKIIFDIKHPQFTPSFATKFNALLKKFKFNDVIFASDNFEVLKKLANFESYKLYFLGEDDENIYKLLTLKNQLAKKNFGAIIAAKFLAKVDVSKLHKNNLKIFAGPVNDEEGLKKVLSFGVSGIITDEVEKMTKVLPAGRLSGFYRVGRAAAVN